MSKTIEHNGCTYDMSGDVEISVFIPEGETEAHVFADRKFIGTRAILERGIINDWCREAEGDTIVGRIAKAGLTIKDVDEWLASRKEAQAFETDEFGGVQVKAAAVDYEAINKDVGELMQFLDSRIGTLRNEILRISAKTGGEHTSHVSMNFYAGEPRLTVEPTEVPLFDPRKHVGETFSKVCKSWREDIAAATGPSSGVAESIARLPEPDYEGLLKSQEFKMAVLAAVRSGIQAGHIKL